jgi:hypothetical protein
MKVSGFWVALFFLFTIKAAAQDKQVLEDFTDNLCACFEKNKGMSDSTIFFHCLNEAFKEVKGLPKTKKEIEKLVIKSTYVLQKDCQSFIEHTSRLYPQKGDWKDFDTNQIKQLDTPACNDFSNKQAFYYLEHDGDTTFVTIKDGIWMDSFKNGKFYSKCSFRWISACDFELEFIKSNEATRKGLSVKGDKYYYKILGKEGNYFKTITYTDKKKVWHEFKLYFL